MVRFVRVVTAAEIPSDRGRPVFVDGKVVVLFKVDGAIHALDDSCPHAGSSLSAGKVVDDEVSVGIDCGESAEPGGNGATATGPAGATAPKPGHLD